MEEKRTVLALFPDCVDTDNFSKVNYMLLAARMADSNFERTNDQCRHQVIIFNVQQL